MPDHHAAQPSAIPVFFLYGEQQQQVDARFLHVEPLEYRSKPSNWKIRPHAHAELNHVLFISHGHGSMSADGASTQFQSPCLLLLPAQRVHGFNFAPDTTGWVLTIAESYLRELIRREPDFATLFNLVQALPVTKPDSLEQTMQNLAQELVWKAPGTIAAIEANLLAILVALLRLSHHASRDHLPPAGRTLEIVARFRALIEAKFRKQAALPDYAAALHITEGQLRRACLHITGRAPVALIHDRILLEAQRILIYTNMTIAEAAIYLGFNDAAYFTRFFTKRAGQSPRDYRRQKLSHSAPL
jgi:AraC family transcriptional activator of pobA